MMTTSSGILVFLCVDVPKSPDQLELKTAEFQLFIERVDLVSILFFARRTNRGLIATRFSGSSEAASVNDFFKRTNYPSKS